MKHIFGHFQQIGYRHLYHQRKLTPADEQYASDVLSMQGNKKILQDHFGNKGHVIILKDLHNLEDKNKWKSNAMTLLNEFNTISGI